jgi:hypothetical protein
VLFYGIAAEPATLTAVELQGGELVRQSVIGDGTTYDEGGRWNPQGRANWILYEARDAHAAGDHPHLWYRETNETATIDIGTGFSRLISWSPDGRYLAIGSDTELSSDPVYDFESVLYVQEVLDGELRTKWRLDEVTEPLHGGSWSFVWQPRAPHI